VSPPGLIGTRCLLQGELGFINKLKMSVVRGILLSGGLVYRRVASTTFRTGCVRLSSDEKVVKLKLARFPKIYTKTGDKGTSALFTGERRPKNDMIFEALGNTDELSSHIGMAIALAEQNKHPYAGQLQRVQCILQDIGSCIATPLGSARDSHLEKVGFSSRHTTELEEWIDEYSELLPPLQNFILPGGGEAASQIHICRSVCRRAERSVTPLCTAGDCDSETQKYINRLSDFLFTIGRLAARIDRKEETIYTRPTAEGYKPPTDGAWKKSKEKKIKGK